jgi:outer membrane protein TolC
MNGCPPNLSNKPGPSRFCGVWAGLLCCLCALLAAGTGCTRKQYQKSADKEAYKVIAQKSGSVSNMESNFSIQTNVQVKLQDLPVIQKPEESMGSDGTNEVGARVLPLSRALEIAVKNSRNYQNRKESLYLSALDLTLARHRFTPIFSGGASSKYEGTKVQSDAAVDKLTSQQDVTGNGNVGVDMLLHSGARISVDFLSDFTRFVVGDTSVATHSRLAGSITQPLLRNGGYKATMENLTQAERNLLYALRDFTRFRKEYAVQIVTAYYGVLSSRDQVRNAYLGYKAFKKTSDRTRAFVEVGQQRVADLGRLRQEELNNETTWINAIRAYKQNLDQFKILLGFSPEMNLALDDKELERIKIVHPTLSVSDAVRIALANRLDLCNQKDQFEDAERKIGVAANGLKPDLDLVLAANVDSKPGSGLPELDFNKTSWSGGVNLNLPLDRKSERNTYRATLINYERSRRELELKVDSIKLDIYDGWRNLDQARRNYESSDLGVDLSKRRVEEQDMLSELGRATSEEQVAAQNSLTDSLNKRTSALISHYTSKLSLWRDLGILNIKDNGQWEEITDVKK